MKKGYILMKVFLSILIIFIAVHFSGCADIDSGYKAEKMLWKADQQADAILSKISLEKRQPKLSEIEEIIAGYRKVINKYPLEQKSARAHFTIADLYMKMTEYDKARKELKKIIQDFSMPEIASRAQSQIAKSYEDEGKIEEAMLEYDKVKDLYPLTQLGLQAPLYVMQFYQKQGDKANQQRAYRQAVRHYEEILNQFSGTSMVGLYHNYLALAHLQAQEWNKAVKVWDDIISENPDSLFAARAALSKAEVYTTNLKDVNKGIELFEEFVQRYKDKRLLKQARLRLAGLYLTNNQLEKSKQEFSSLIDEFPDDKDLGILCHFGLVSYYQQKKDEEKLMELYKKIQEDYPEDPKSLSIPLFVYQYYVNDKNFIKADEALIDATKKYEDAFRAHINDSRLFLPIARSLLFVYTEGKNWQKLLDLLRLLQSRFPNDPNFPFSIASIYRYQLNKPELAISVYKEMLKQYSSNEQLAGLIKDQISALQQPELAVE